MNGTAEQRFCITWRETDLRGNLWRSDRRMCLTQHWQNGTKSYYRPYTSNSVWWKNFVKTMDRTGSAFKYLAEKFHRISEAKLKRGFCGSSDPQALQRRYFQQPTSGRREKKLGTCFVWCQLTSSGISGQKTTRNWLRTCHRITNLVAMCP